MSAAVEKNRVDVHVHPTRFSRVGREYARRNGIEYSPEGLLREMDRAGVRWGVFLAPRLAPSLEDQLAEQIEVARSSGGRLLPTGTVNPTLGEREIDRALSLWDSSELPPRAVKLYPGYWPFSVDDPRLEPLYAWAERRSVPVFVHCGDTSDPNGLVRYSRPIYLDDVAVRWRGVRFVLCHLGNPWVEEAAEIIYKNANVYGDTSGLLTPFAPYVDRMRERMRRRVQAALDAIGAPDRLLYGSDWPLMTLGDAMGLVEGLEIPKADRERILGGNARGLFGLGDE
jgi:predicted TIM-barrel fold metal-dependent hydrolase